MTASVPAELPAILHGAFLLDHFSTDDERLAYLEGRLSAPSHHARWNELKPQQRKHWEAVAAQAVRFLGDA